MERLLLNLVGVGVVLCADAQKDGPMPHASASGSELVRRCLAADVPRLESLVSGIAASLWTRLHDGSAALPAARSIAMATILLQRHAPPAALLVAARSAICTPDGRCDARGAALARLVESVTSSALIEGTLDHAGVSRTEATAVLTTVFDTLLDHADDIEHTASEIVGAVTNRELSRHSDGGASHCDDESELWHADALDELAARCSTELGLPRALIDDLIATERVSGASREAISQHLEELVAAAIETLDGIRRLADLTGASDDLEQELLDVVASVREGRFAAGEAHLAAVRGMLEDASLPLHTASRHQLAIGIETSRARLAQHLGAWREAALLFRKAGRCAEPHERLLRWRLKLAEGRALARLAALPGSRFSVLIDAAQIYAEAGGIVSEQDSPLEWAEANLELGALLLDLGNRQCRPERFLAAALHFKPAVDVLTRERSMDGWARGQIGLAHALRGQGAFQGDTVTLSDAAFAYRAALGYLTRGMTPALWYEANAALGETLVRFAEETGDLLKLQEAIEILMPLVAPELPASKARTMAELALGRGMYLLLELEGNAASDGSMLVEALTLVEGALAAPVEHLNALDRARGQRLRGDILWRQYEADADIAPIALIIDAKQRARELYLALENEPEAEQIEREIELLRQRPDSGGEGSSRPRASVNADALAWPHDYDSSSVAIFHPADQFATP